MLLSPLPIDMIPVTLPWSAEPLHAPVGVHAPARGLPVPAFALPCERRGSNLLKCVDTPDEEEEDLGDEEDLAVAQPAADEESSFDDFDDEFDDDFEEEENDPDWDHPDDSAPESPPPGKGGGRKK